MIHRISPTPWSPFNTQALIRSEANSSLSLPPPDAMGGGSVDFQINPYVQSMVGPGTSAPALMTWTGEGGNIHDLIRLMFLVKTWRVHGQIHHLNYIKYFRKSPGFPNYAIGSDLVVDDPLDVDFETETQYGGALGFSAAAPPENFGARAVIPLEVRLPDDSIKSYGSFVFDGVAFDPWLNKFFLRFYGSAVSLDTLEVVLEDDEPDPTNRFGYGFDIGTDVASMTNNEPPPSSLFGKSSALQKNDPPTLNFPAVSRPYSPGYNPIDDSVVWRKVSNVAVDSLYNIAQYATNTQNCADFDGSAEPIPTGYNLALTPASYWEVA